ncbi:MAG: hypothetical protein LBV65_04905 [Desulfovibrio sp.]|nr:hypothetical protein [Desulfovibrio sp.]
MAEHAQSGNGATTTGIPNTRPCAQNEDFSHYFVVDSWESPSVIRLIRRNSEQADSLFELPMPKELLDDFYAEHGNWRGISAPTQALKDWLTSRLLSKKKLRRINALRKTPFPAKQNRTATTP